MKTEESKLVEVVKREEKLFACIKCGTKHGPKKCPAFMKECENCRKKGHLKKMCRTKTGDKKKFLKKEQKTLTKEDEELQELTRLVQNGWPKNVYEVKKTMRHFWNYREEIAQYEGILCKGERVIIPKKLQQQVLKSIHEGHLGIQSCLKRARELVYWTQMNNDVKNMINKCSICQSRQRDTQPEPTISRGIPNRPWQTVSTDMFYFNNNEYR
ncbi:hypothetical protein CBL_08523 [Carabus blaptoides fortunei]